MIYERAFDLKAQEKILSLLMPLSIIIIITGTHTHLSFVINFSLDAESLQSGGRENCPSIVKHVGFLM